MEERIRRNPEPWSYGWRVGIPNLEEAVRRACAGTRADLERHAYIEARHYVLPNASVSSYHIVTVVDDDLHGLRPDDAAKLRRAVSHVLSDAVCVIEVCQSRGTTFLQTEFDDFTIEVKEASRTPQGLGPFRESHARRPMTDEHYPNIEKNWRRAVELGFWMDLWNITVA